jgi:hypothetical protein
MARPHRPRHGHPPDQPGEVRQDDPVDRLAVPSANAFPKYFDLYSRFTLLHWDAMLLAACKETGVTTLYCEDTDPATDYDGLRIVNPFL